MISDRKVDRVQDALSQMRTIVERYVRCSLNGDLYMKALECLRAIREACVKEDEAPTFNQFMAGLKDKFGHGAHQEFFAILVKEKLSLITFEESEISSVVTKAEAQEFLKVNAKS